MEPARRIELRLRPYQGRVLTVTTKQAYSVPGAGLEPARAAFKERPGCRQPTPDQSRLPVSNGSPRRYKLRALPAELRRHRVLGAIRTHAAQFLRLVPPAVGLRGHGASGPTRTACLFLTKEPLCQVSYEGLAPGAGVEPTLTASEAGILPLDDPGSVWSGRPGSNRRG